ncbi:hypothetical protein ACFOHY_03430 [Rhizobium rosettiformans]
MIGPLTHFTKLQKTTPANGRITANPISNCGLLAGAPATRHKA